MQGFNEIFFKKKIIEKFGDIKTVIILKQILTYYRTEGPHIHYQKEAKKNEAAPYRNDPIV